jgi:hypothetical protein
MSELTSHHPEVQVLMDASIAWIMALRVEATVDEEKRSAVSEALAACHSRWGQAEEIPKELAYIVVN